MPNEGELTPDVIRPVLEKFLDLPVTAAPAGPQGDATRPTLCAGCAHRAAFYAIRETFPAGIFPGDIGCYTLGMNLGAVDTCHCMRRDQPGRGLLPRLRRRGRPGPHHRGHHRRLHLLPRRYPRPHQCGLPWARIILVILDNATTAMTGHQPTPRLGLTATGAPATRSPSRSWCGPAAWAF